MKKIQGSIDLGYIGLFDDSQIDIETSDLLFGRYCS